MRRWHVKFTLSTYVLLSLLLVPQATSFLSTIAYCFGKKILKQGPTMALKSLKAMGNDQMQAGLFVGRAFGKACNMMAPYLGQGFVHMGSTVARAVLAATSYVQERLRTRKALADGPALIREGPRATMPLLAWLQKHAALLEANPVEAVTLLQAACKAKHTSLLDLIISKTQHILLGKRMPHQLYCSLMLNPHLPTRYLRAALGTENPMSVLGAEWWLNEFMSAVVTFPPDAFYEYMSGVFFSVFTSPHNNAVIERIQVPPIDRHLPMYVQMQMMYVDHLGLYYLLRQPLETKHLRRVMVQRGQLNMEAFMRALDYYLELSGFIRRLREGQDEQAVHSIADWINIDVLRHNRVGAEMLTRLRLTRVVEVILLGMPSSKNGPTIGKTAIEREARKQCSPALYAVLLVHGAIEGRAKGTLPPSPPPCAPLKVVTELYQEAKKMPVKRRCAEIITRALTVHIDPSIVGEAMKVLKDPTDMHIIVGVLLESIFGISQHSDNVSVVAARLSPNAVTIEGLTNEIIRAHCQCHRQWPRVLLRVAPGKGSVQLKAAEGSSDQEEADLANPVMQELVRLVKMDAATDFSRVLNDALWKKRLSFRECAQLARRIMNMTEAVGSQKDTVFKMLLQYTLLNFKQTHFDQFVALIREIRENRHYRKVIAAGFNDRALGLR